MDAWFGAPLVAQDRERFKRVFGKLQQIDQNGAVKGMARVIAVRFVGWQECPIHKVGKNIFGLRDLLRAEGARV